MWLPIILLFLVTCQASSLVGFYNEENTGFRSDLRHAEFGEKVRDWFRNLKERLFGRKVQPDVSEEKNMMNLNKAELQERVRNSGGFFVDLSRLTFDPKVDIGFRIGRWYFIRIGDSFDNEFGYNDSNEWDMSVTVSSDQSTHQLSNDNWSTYGDNPMLETTSLPLTTETDLWMEEVTTENDAIESSTTEIFKSEEDNETGFGLDSGSVQVVSP